MTLKFISFDKLFNVRNLHRTNWRLHKRTILQIRLQIQESHQNRLRMNLMRHMLRKICILIVFSHLIELFKSPFDPLNPPPKPPRPKNARADVATMNKAIVNNISMTFILLLLFRVNIF